MDHNYGLFIFCCRQTTGTRSGRLSADNPTGSAHHASDWLHFRPTAGRSGRALALAKGIQVL